MIEKGVEPTDRVVIVGLQQIRPRMQVEPELTPMPTLEPGANGEMLGPEEGRPQPPPPGGHNPNNQKGR